MILRQHVPYLSNRDEFLMIKRCTIQIYVYFTLLKLRPTYFTLSVVSKIERTLPATIPDGPL